MTEHEPLILIVDENKDIIDFLVRIVRSDGFKVLTANNRETALAMIRSEKPDLMLLDSTMEDVDRMELLRQAKVINQDLPVIFLGGHRDTHGAVMAIKAGAYDYLAKPFQSNELMQVIHQAFEERTLGRKVKNISSKLQETRSLKETMGPSDGVARIMSEVNRVAESDFTVVITGETGSGKELIARAIHEASPDRTLPSFLWTAELYSRNPTRKSPLWSRARSLHGGRGSKTWQIRTGPGRNPVSR